MKATLEAVKVDVSQICHRDTEPCLVGLTGQCVKVAEPVLSVETQIMIIVIGIGSPVCPGRQHRPCLSQIGPSQSSRSTWASLLHIIRIKMVHIGVNVVQAFDICFTD